MYRQLAILLLIAAAAQATIVEPCGGTATLHGVNVEDCEDSVDGPCIFVKGRQYRVTVDASANSVATALPYTAKTNVLGIPVTMFEGNACESLTTGNCPAQVGERFVFEKSIDVTNTYPNIQSVLTVEVKDHAGTVLLCARIKFQIAQA